MIQWEIHVDCQSQTKFWVGEPTNCKAGNRMLSFVYSSASAPDSDKLVFTSFKWHGQYGYTSSDSVILIFTSTITLSFWLWHSLWWKTCLNALMVTQHPSLLLVVTYLTFPCQVSKSLGHVAFKLNQHLIAMQGKIPWSVVKTSHFKKNLCIINKWIINHIVCA